MCDNETVKPPIQDLPAIQFDLPFGGIVTIANKEYIHLGNGRFTGHQGSERPYIIEGSLEDESGQIEKTVLLTPMENRNRDASRVRVVWMAGTVDEIKLLSG